MAKLLFKKDFTLEVGEEFFKGVFNDLNKSQKAEFEKSNKQKKSDNKKLQGLVRDLKKIARKIEVKEHLEKWDEVETLEEQKEVLESSTERLTEKLADPALIEAMFKKRIEISVESDDLDKILSAGEFYGYQNVYNTILQDIEDRQSKK